MPKILCRTVLTTKLHTPNPVKAITRLTTEATRTGKTSGITNFLNSIFFRSKARGIARKESHTRLDDITIIIGITRLLL